MAIMATLFVVRFSIISRLSANARSPWFPLCSLSVSGDRAAVSSIGVCPAASRSIDHIQCMLPARHGVTWSVSQNGAACYVVGVPNGVSSPPYCHAAMAFTTRMVAWLIRIKTLEIYTIVSHRIWMPLDTY